MFGCMDGQSPVAGWSIETCTLPVRLGKDSNVYRLGEECNMVSYMFGKGVIRESMFLEFQPALPV